MLPPAPSCYCPSHKPTGRELLSASFKLWLWTGITNESILSCCIHLAGVSKSHRANTRWLNEAMPLLLEGKCTQLFKIFMTAWSMWLKFAARGVSRGYSGICFSVFNKSLLFPPWFWCWSPPSTSPWQHVSSHALCQHEHPCRCTSSFYICLGWLPVLWSSLPCAPWTLVTTRGEMEVEGGKGAPFLSSLFLEQLKPFTVFLHCLFWKASDAGAECTFLQRL